MVALLREPPGLPILRLFAQFPLVCLQGLCQAMLLLQRLGKLVCLQGLFQAFLQLQRLAKHNAAVMSHSFRETLAKDPPVFWSVGMQAVAWYAQIHFQLPSFAEKLL